MPRYKVVTAVPFEAQMHRAGSVGRTGLCSLHACGEPAVATMVGRTSSGREVTLAVCERGVREYDLERQLRG